MAYSIRSIHHSTLGHSPARLVFGRDMLMSVNVEADWKKIKDKKMAKEYIERFNLRTLAFLENESRLKSPEDSSQYIIEGIINNMVQEMSLLRYCMIIIHYLSSSQLKMSFQLQMIKTKVFKILSHSILMLPQIWIICIGS